MNICIVHTASSELPHVEKNTHVQVDALKDSVSFPWSIEQTEDGELMLFNVVTGKTQTVRLETPAPSVGELGNDQPQYEALSYTWGSGSISEFVQVEVNDQGATNYPAEQRTALGVRSNLASALRHLRLPGKTRVLWIDAICINQEDMEERNTQVKRMAHIYTTAHRVVVWLGEEAGDSKHALQTLQHVGRQLEYTISGRVIAAPNATEPKLWRSDHAAGFDSPTWQALMSLVERPWFYRIWCWQEIKLGGRQALLVCGKDTIPWGDFWLAVLCLNNKDSSPSIEFRERCRHIVFSKYAAEAMSSILDISRSKGCADPRDKIYGLLAITPASFASGIVVDYSRPAQEVYKEAFLAHLITTKRLELLKHCNLADRHSAGGPTWVPDWSKTEFAAPILSEQLSSGISRAWFTYVEPNILEVMGKVYTTIETISEAASKTTGKTLLAVKDWFRYLPPGETYVAGDNMEAAFALTLCMNRTRERHPYIHFKSVAEYVITMHTILDLPGDSLNHPIYSERETANMIQKIRGRRFFTTKDGYIGTAPASAQIGKLRRSDMHQTHLDITICPTTGDSICLLLGAYAPIVLRQTPLGSFQVVGECYVHGLADAFGLLGPIPYPWKTIIKGDSLGRPTSRFLNSETGEETLEDPRLGPLPPSWGRASYERRAGDPDIMQRFENDQTGEIVNHDPRLSPEMLQRTVGGLQSLRLA